MNEQRDNGGRTLPIDSSNVGATTQQALVLFMVCNRSFDGFFEGLDRRTRFERRKQGVGERVDGNKQKS